MPSLKTLPPDAPASEIKTLLETDGALILRDMIGAAALARVNAELRPYIDSTPVGRDAISGNRTTRTGALVARSPATRELIMDKRILAGCDAFLLPSCERYQLHLAQVIR